MQSHSAVGAPGAIWLSERDPSPYRAAIPTIAHPAAHVHGCREILGPIHWQIAEFWDAPLAFAGPARSRPQRPSPMPFGLEEVCHRPSPIHGQAPPKLGPFVNNHRKLYRSFLDGKSKGYQGNKIDKNRIAELKALGVFEGMS